VLTHACLISGEKLKKHHFADKRIVIVEFEEIRVDV